MSTPKVYGYARASTVKQSESPIIQKETIKRYCEYNKLAEVAAYYVDAGVSAKIPLGERQAGKALLIALRPGDHLVIAKIDRAFRNLGDCVTILESFQRRKINLHICDLFGGSFDLSSPMGMFLIQILAAVAELERKFNSERVKEGLKNKKHAGFKYTRDPGYGFRWEVAKDAKGRVIKDSKGRVCKERVPDEEEREIMKKIAMWRLQEPAYSWLDILTHLRNLGITQTKDGTEWDLSRVRRVCKAEFKLQMAEQRGNR